MSDVDCKLFPGSTLYQRQNQVHVLSENGDEAELFTFRSTAESLSYLAINLY